MTGMHTVVGLPHGRPVKVETGTGLRAALRRSGIGVESICAENATCGKCLVIIEDGEFHEHGLISSGEHLSPPSTEEFNYLQARRDLLERRGWRLSQVRLACQARVQGDLVVTVPEESRLERQIVRKSPGERAVEIRPSLRKYLVELSPPSLANPKADWERLASGLATSMGLVRDGEAGPPNPEDLTIDPMCMRGLPAVLREARWRVTVSVRQDREVVRVESGLSDRLVGAAVDVGTTTVAAYLSDLSTGETLAVAADMNPQVAFGEDVMARIQYCNVNPAGLERQHRGIIRLVNRLLAEAATDAGLDRLDILELVVVGNTTMMHLFLGLSPSGLGAAPFAPVVAGNVELKARDLRLALNPAASVHVLPAIASFIGADTTAVLIAEAPHEQDEDWLIIDIGTNAELVLGNRHRLVCASTPTGPALEGAHIANGMRAVPGAIEHIRIDAASLLTEWRLVGEEAWGAGKPKGICGSGVVDAVAELVRVGILDSSGRFRTPETSDAPIRQGPNGPEFVIVPAAGSSSGADICLTQHDVRQIQLAKAALFVAAESLLERLGIEQPDKLLLAGAFGSYMDKANAMALGMLPRVPLDRVYVVGNAAGDGARIALLNIEKRNEALQLSRRLVRHELPADPEFQARFIGALAFPERLDSPREDT